MQVVWAQQPLPATVKKSIFLAGPTPRSADVHSWRIFKELGYDGHVYIPQEVDCAAFNAASFNWNAQIEWEEQCLHAADVIVFWICRNLETLPGLTTNDEYGAWKHSGKVVLGAPPTAFKTGYQKYYAKKLEVPFFTTLKETLEGAMKMIGDGAVRNGNEVKIPYMIWRTPEFSHWYAAQKQANNTLENARMEWSFRVGPKMNFLFFWALHVDVFIAKESRHKKNEVIISRPDIACVVLFYKGDNLNESKVVLTKEYRSPGCNSAGFIFELPGGSSWEPTPDPKHVALEEVSEECGLKIDPDKLQLHSARQMMATLSIHRAHVYSYELSKDELDWLLKQEKECASFGVSEDTEKTCIPPPVVSKNCFELVRYHCSKCW